ncbi:Hypothetical predicted protein [Paramuricea clavata]|uniref:Uncharacterized protein n=1 Tax=Paramuricea clavata TaxID=317549 RepID=A0A7D9K419_PARCT|nr:Hypothetical predicted protein [Paramuricea clavata]
MASSEHLLEKPSTVTPVQQSTGNKVENHVSNDASNHVQPSGVTSPPKGVQVKVGPPLYVENPKTNPQSSAQTKVSGQKLTPLIDNYHKELKPDGKVKRSNSWKKYFLSKKARKNEITIKLPEIPPCPDMKNYHWPWNCLDKGNTVKKECIQNYPGTFSYQGARFPYEDYGHLYDYNANENGNYYDTK